MKLTKLALAIATTSIAMGGAAFAEDASGPSVAFNVGVASDYVFRGFSQTDEGVQVFGGADVTSGMLYAGVWASNVDFLDSTDAEVDLYAGVKPTLGPVSLDIGGLYYAYPGSPKGSGYDYFEAKVAGSVPVGKGTVGAAVFYSPDFFGAVDSAVYYEVNASTPIVDKLSISGALGHQSLEGPGDYTTWNVGLGYALNDHLGVDVRYFDTDFKSKISNGRAAVSLKATF